MKAVCYYGKGDVRVETVPDPEILNPRDAIVRVTATAICGSDLHIYGGYIPTMQKGDVLGHEFMGEVVAVGPENHRLKVGDRVVVHSGVVIGADGFGIAMDAGRWIKIPQIGRVVIGNDVEIGANTTIDRGAIDDTVIEEGVKLDNQIQIAHNVRIGAHTAIAACVGIAGSTRIGRHCRIGGAAGLAGHITIADGVEISGYTAVTKSIHQPGVYSGLYPFEANRDWRRNAIHLRHLADLAERLRSLEKRFAALGRSKP